MVATLVDARRVAPSIRKARRTPPALAPRADTARTSRTTNDLRGGVGGPEDKHVYAQRTARCGEVWRGLEQSAWLSTVTCCVPSVECARSVTPSAPPASALPATCPTRAPLVARRKGLPGGGLKPTVKNTETWKSICAGVHTCCAQRALSLSLVFLCHVHELAHGVCACAMGVDGRCEMCLATHDRGLWRAGLSPPPRPAYPHERGVVAGGRCGGRVGADRAPRLLGDVGLVELRLVEAPFDHVEVVRQPLGGDGQLRRGLLALASTTSWRTRTPPRPPIRCHQTGSCWSLLGARTCRKEAHPGAPLLASCHFRGRRSRSSSR